MEMHYLSTDVRRHTCMDADVWSAVERDTKSVYAGESVQVFEVREALMLREETSSMGLDPGIKQS